MMKYYINEFCDKSFSDKMDLTRFVKKNKDKIYLVKKSLYKTNLNFENIEVRKRFEPQIDDITSDVIEVKAVINTTNIIDSYMDLHLSTVWDTTVAENKYTYHLENHGRNFKDIISSNAIQTNEKMNFKDLGLDKDFPTVANINTLLLSKNDNPEMFKRYISGDVRQHSVGMQYLSLSLAMYDEDDEKEMNYFNEKLKEAVNPEVAEERGYFWVISEAKKIEGSAVLFGANSITPTIYVKNHESKPKSKNKNFELNNFLN